jgi:RHS repeat-associated protein
VIGEYDGSNNVLASYGYGPGPDEPAIMLDYSIPVWRALHADERGSIIALSYGSATVTNVNRYDEYGTPQSGNFGRFQYTGQMWLPEAGVYHYKARMYSPDLGRFLQTPRNHAENFPSPGSAPRLYRPSWDAAFPEARSQCHRAAGSHRSSGFPECDHILRAFPP